jgi:hypothetical protein
MELVMAILVIVVDLFYDGVDASSITVFRKLRFLAQVEMRFTRCPYV